MYLLDSSAWLAHILRESGGVEVNQFLRDEKIDVYISVLSLLEVHSRLNAVGQSNRWVEVLETYRPRLLMILPVSEQITRRAIAIRATAEKRIPAIDSLIAATAAVHGLTLVHRDSHLTGIPDSVVTQIQLLDK